MITNGCTNFTRKLVENEQQWKVIACHRFISQKLTLHAHRLHLFFLTHWLSNIWDESLVCPCVLQSPLMRWSKFSEQKQVLRFSLWLFRYYLKTYVYTPSTPCRDVKFCPNIPLGDLSWNLLTEVIWHYQINGFSNSKFWKHWQENVHVGLENDWSGSFVLLYGWNNEDVRWDFSLFKSIKKLWAI